MQAYFALIDDFRHRDAEIFIMRFFLNIFCSKCSFFSYVGHRFFICKMWNKMFWRDKKKFHNPVILFLFWFVSFHYHSFRSQKRLTSEFLWLFWIFFILFRFFNLLGAILFFGGFFLYVGEEVFFIIHKQIFDDFSIFLYIFFYIGIFFLEALLENNPWKKSCFCSSFLSNFRPGWSWVFFVFVLIFFDFSWLVFK